MGGGLLKEIMEEAWMNRWMDGVVEEAFLDADQVASNHRGILTRV